MHVRNFELQKMYLFHPYFQAVQQRIEAFETEEKANREALEQVHAEKESLHKELSENKDQVFKLNDMCISTYTFVPYCPSFPFFCLVSSSYSGADLRAKESEFLKPLAGDCRGDPSPLRTSSGGIPL